MAYFGVDTQIRIEELEHQLKNVIRQKGGFALPQLRGLLCDNDTEGCGSLTFDQFERALSTFG